MKRPCLDCGTLIGSGSRCRSCRAVVERRRGTPAQRGYGRDHYRARALLAETLPDTCGYCGLLVAPESRWVAAHVVDGDPTAGWMVAHGACNERAKNKPSRGRDSSEGVSRTTGGFRYGDSTTVPLVRR